jgi:hypothetical protein
MDVRRVVLLLLLCSACSRTPSTARVALLAPFEGRYREIGYNALYAARLALADTPQVELLAVDAGASVVDRARALAADPQVVAAVVLGYTEQEAFAAFGDAPVLVVGSWGAVPSSNTLFVLSNPDIQDALTTDPQVSITEAARLETPITGGDVLALEQFPRLRDSLDGVTILSSGSLPDADFAARYTANDPFAPEPGLLATLTYDAFEMLLATMRTDNLAALRDAIAGTTYEGLNGAIRFEHGYWADAPIYRYGYDADRQLIRLP